MTKKIKKTGTEKKSIEQSKEISLPAGMQGVTLSGQLPAGIPELPPGLKIPSEKEMPEDVKKKLKEIKDTLEKFKKVILKKFDKYVIGLALLPPPEKEWKKEDKKIHVLVLVDDTEPSKMSRFEMATKLNKIIEEEAKKVEKKLTPRTVLLSELWQKCYDGKYDLLKLVALSAPVYDTGMLSAIKIAEVHKSMVLEKFEKYIVAYVLAGSLVQGKATKKSDIDVFLVVDDTDVKKMTRVELKDKLRALIIGMGIRAGEITGIKNKLNVQVYILTDFWESMREANPVIFTFLRDGVPFYDRGIFMPWKQLLKMGKIKPSPEAIDMYMSSGEQVLDRIRFKLKNIGVEDFFWAIFTPSQAAIMLYGIPPPTPKETPELIRELFVHKEKLLEEKYVKVLEDVLKKRKEIEHGEKKEVLGIDIDDLLKRCNDYLKRIRKLFTQIETLKDEERVIKIYETISTILRDVLRMEGVEQVKDSEIIKVFEEKMIAAGKIPSKHLRSLQNTLETKKDYDAGKLTKTEIQNFKKSANELVKYLVEYMQRKRWKDLNKVKIKVKYGEKKYGEVTILGNTTFIIHDVDEEEKRISKAKVKKDGTLDLIEKSSLEEFEKALARIAVPEKVFIRGPTFDSLEKIFGKDVEILIG